MPQGVIKQIIIYIIIICDSRSRLETCIHSMKTRCNFFLYVRNKLFLLYNVWKYVSLNFNYSKVVSYWLSLLIFMCLHIAIIEGNFLLF